MSDAQLTYDLMLLIDSTVEAEQKAKIVADAEAGLAKAGEIIGKHDYGMRKMTFEIDKKSEADYHLIQFHVTDKKAMAALDSLLRITDGVLRHRIIKLEPGTPAPPDLKATATESAPIPESAFDEDESETVSAA